mgnify:CR=1 FL=1
MSRLAVVLIALSATGCADRLVTLKPALVERAYLRDQFRPGDLTCGDEPSGSRVERLSQAYRYIIDLRDWGRDCRTKLGVARDAIGQEK